jgi:hypothetical protein
MTRARTENFSEFPEAFPAASNKAKQEYRRSDTHFAVHGRKPSPDATMTLRAERIAVYPLGRLSDFPDAVQRTPVYALQPGGRLAVPTGRVFVRLAPDQRFQDHAESFRKAGYDVIEAVPYAPNAGWLRSAGSSIAGALTGLPALTRIRGVENVEPEMLAEAARKD